MATQLTAWKSKKYNCKLLVSPLKFIIEYLWKPSFFPVQNFRVGSPFLEESLDFGYFHASYLSQVVIKDDRKESYVLRLGDHSYKKRFSLVEWPKKNEPSHADSNCEQSKELFRLDIYIRVFSSFYVRQRRNIDVPLFIGKLRASKRPELRKPAGSCVLFRVHVFFCSFFVSSLFSWFLTLSLCLGAVFWFLLLPQLFF